MAYKDFIQSNSYSNIQNVHYDKQGTLRFNVVVYEDNTKKRVLSTLDFDLSRNGKTTTAKKTVSTKAEIPEEQLCWVDPNTQDAFLQTFKGFLVYLNPIPTPPDPAEVNPDNYYQFRPVDAKYLYIEDEDKYMMLSPDLEFETPGDYDFPESKWAQFFDISVMGQNQKDVLAVIYDYLNTLGTFSSLEQA